MKLSEMRPDLVAAVISAGGEVVSECRRGGEKWYIEGDEMYHTSWIFCGPEEEPSHAFCVADLEDAIREDC